MEKERPRFIRVNGRIIPIFSKDKKKDRGVKELALASTVAAAGGLIAGIKTRKADNMHQQVFDFFEEKKGVKLPKGVDDITTGFIKASNKYRFAKRIAFGARLGAAAIAFAGINNLLHNEKDSDLKSAAKLTGAAVTSELVSRGIYSGFRKKQPFSMPISQGTWNSSKKLLKSLFKKAAL